MLRNVEANGTLHDTLKYQPDSEKELYNNIILKSSLH